MAEEVKFSVVLPAYNVAQEIGQMLQCLLQQTYRNFEVIVVDDCATDDTAEVAQGYGAAFADGRIPYCVLRKPQNEGLSMARNTGMAQAKGEYILFLDADDTVEANLLETIGAALDGRDADMVIFGYTEDYYREQTLDYRVDKQPELYYFTEGLSQPRAQWQRPLLAAYPYIVWLEQQTMFGYAWNKAYRLEMLREQEICFEPVMHIEDILFNLKVAEHMTGMVSVPEELYHYANRGQARLTSRYLPEYFALQKTRIEAFYQMQIRKLQIAEQVASGDGEQSAGDSNRMPQEEIAIWRQQLYETMAGAYFRAFMSSIVRSIRHGDARKEILARGQAELGGKLYLQLHDHLDAQGRVARILYRPLALGNLKSAYRRAKLIAWVQEHMAGLYVKWKQNR